VFPETERSFKPVRDSQASRAEEWALDPRLKRSESFDSFGSKTFRYRRSRKPLSNNARESVRDKLKRRQRACAREARLNWCPWCDKRFRLQMQP